LLKRPHARAANSDATGHPEALAWFDVGYLAETYKQWMGQGEPNAASGLEGYGWVKRAISLRGQDPQMEFAAALITVGSLENEHQEHVQKAAGGAKIDPLLARNLAMHFMGNSGKTASEMLAKELE
jgi:hypothetical protein